MTGVGRFEPYEPPEWRAVRGYEGSYEVSSDGRVRSLPRSVRSRWNCYRRIPGVLLRQSLASNGRLCVSLSLSQRRKTLCVHRLVAEAFLAESYFPGAQVCHNDGDPHNNRVSNLRWGTASENALDAVRHGTHPEARKTHCRRNHPYDEYNTVHRPYAPHKRRCRECDRINCANQRQRKRAS